MNRRLVTLSVAALVLAACRPGDLESLEPVESNPTAAPETTQSAPAPEPSESPENESETPDDTPSAMAEAGIDWPEVSPDNVDWGAAPKAPAGFTAADVSGLAKPLQSWALRAALDPSVWSGKATPADVLAPIGSSAQHVAAAAGRSVSPRLAVGNVFGEGVEVVGSPRMTTAWRVETEDTRRGPLMRVWLQTRTAYEVRHDGQNEVIGVIREHALGTLQGGAPHGIFSVTGWYEFGAEKCPLAIDDALVPPSETPTKALEQFAKLGSRKAYACPELDREQQIDGSFRKRCQRAA